MIRDLQSSAIIKQHLKELKSSVHKSTNKDILHDHIVFWINRLSLKIKEEKKIE